MAAHKKFTLRPRRRANGETTWYARFTDQHGTRQEIPVGMTPHMDAEAAEKAMAHIKADVERGVWRRPEPSKRLKIDPQAVLFGDVAFDWWAEMIEGRKAETTQKAYRAELDHIMPVFSKRRVADIGRRDIDRFVSAQIRKGLAPS